MMFNAGTNGTDFAFPPLPQGFRWHLAVDTPSAPQDVFIAVRKGFGSFKDLQPGSSLQRDILARKQVA